MILTGGGALLNGMADRLQHDLSLNVTVPEDPLTTVALGAGRLLAEPERLQRARRAADGIWAVYLIRCSWPNPKFGIDESRFEAPNWRLKKTTWAGYLKLR